MVWSALDFEFGNPLPQSLLRFPAVCIIGFVPHILVLLGIIVCLIIYGLGLLLSALAPTTDSLTLNLHQRLVNAHGNMQANLSLSAIRITRDMDFYTALLRTGFVAIRMASEAVYLNEDRSVSMPHHTWLEEARFREAEELRSQVVGMRFPDDQIGTIGHIPIKEGTKPGTTGFGRERAAQKVTRGRSGRGGRIAAGVTERSSTWLMALDYLLNISRLFARVSALSVLWFLSRLRIRTQPASLLWLARRQKLGTDDRASRGKNHELSGQDSAYLPGQGVIPGMDEIDVETEFRRQNGNQDEASLDAELYSHWASGGWWGVNDLSGDYVPKESNALWDTTSVLSTSSVETEDEACEVSPFDDDNHGSLARTSTMLSRESRLVPDPIWDINHFARLLHPATLEEREEAQALSAHLQSDRIMTRSAFRRYEQVRRSRVLLHPGYTSHRMSTSANRNTRLMSLDDDEVLLEQMILSRRQLRSPKSHEVHASSTAKMETEDGKSLPCVVCHMSARTIIVWPCRCLSLCDDCRVSLAMNNFDKCVCCRREVLSFSRIFVP
ncbi:hypothetical protein E4U41_004949 [Claviceps citrina]|nr:hypothetical protein E4U41_004949 [Claviceps citrina]